jgi:hypothetical protein
MIRLASLLPLACLCLVSQAGRSQPADNSLDKPWFVPSLEVNHDAICPSVLQAARAHFKSSSGWEGVDFRTLIKGVHPYRDGDTEGADPNVEVDQENPAHYVINQHGKKLFVHFRTNPGCGGACESESLLVSGKPFEDYEEATESKVASTPASDAWLLYRSTDGIYYAVSLVDAQLQLYALASPEAFELSCAVAVAPGDLEHDNTPGLKDALTAIKELTVAAGAMSGGAGACGSMNTAGRWQSYVQSSLPEVLYRPWALNKPQSSSENSYGDWKRIVEGLELWSLTGLAEHDAYRQFQTEFPKASARIAGFYEKAFGWTPERSQATATLALTDALSRGFGFYRYEPFQSPEEIAWRTAIAERRPLSEIKQLPGDPARHKEFWSESILTLAIPYPGALKYLLGRGAAVDEANGFGKTPLMYAAQYDQWESAKILLDAGADPNAATFIPQDMCNYTLRTDAMTPLHYASRYGSARLINLLLERGAFTFAEAPSDPGEQSDALHWVMTNSKISPLERLALSRKLRTPDVAERRALSRTWVARAEVEYASGKSETAFRTLRNAFRADDTNEQAIADLPIVALRASRSAEAMHAADYALSHFTEPAQRAEALFNKGLICQSISTLTQKASWQVPRMCNEDFMQLFVTSYDMDETPVRAQALERILTKDGASMCTITRPDGQKLHIWEYGGPFAEPWSISKYSGLHSSMMTEGYRIYLLHSSDQAIEPNSIHWVTPPSGARPSNQPVEASPHLIATYHIGSDELTIVEADFSRTGIRGEVLMVGEHRCDFDGKDVTAP